MNTEQQINQKFFVPVGGKTPLQALEMLQQVNGDNIISHKRLFEWLKRFKERCETVKDDARSGRLSISKTEVNIE